MTDTRRARLITLGLVGGGGYRTKEQSTHAQVYAAHAQCSAVPDGNIRAKKKIHLA